VPYDYCATQREDQNSALKSNFRTNRSPVQYIQNSIITSQSFSPDAAAVNVWETVTVIQMPINFATLPPSLLMPRNNEGIALLRVAIMLDFLKAADLHLRS
jgi:hypothetical protein